MAKRERTGGYLTGGTLVFLVLLGAAGGFGPASAADVTPPAAVTDLDFPSIGAPDLKFDPETGTLRGVPLVLTWTAPGDDGDLGRAWRYDVRFIRGRLDDATWSRAVPMADPLDLPLPAPAGEVEVLAFLEFSGLAPGAHYEIGIRALDEAGNAGPLSNVAGFEAPGQSETFVETVALNGLELWAWGLKMDGPEVECRYENSALAIDGQTRPFLPEETPPSIYFGKYGPVPTVRELVAEGVALEEAVYRYLRLRRDFLVEMSTLGRDSGIEAVQARLAASDLVDSVMVVNRFGGHLILRGEGARSEFLWDRDEPGIPAFHYDSVSTRPEPARAAVDWLRDHAADAGDEPGVAVFARGGMLYLYSRRDLTEFRQQVAHLERGGRLEKLPRGPLSEGPAREFLLMREYLGEQKGN